jgi:hypothetical protein
VNTTTENQNVLFRNQPYFSCWTGRFLLLNDDLLGWWQHGNWYELADG